MEKISVAVRFRPPKSSTEADVDYSCFSGGGAGGNREWRIDDTRISLLHRAVPVPGTSFAFDHVFDETATNARIYGLLVGSLIRAAVDGFNGTAFAYGQTSSGKTFTMNGSGANPGIIPLAVRDIFDTAAEAADREFLIRVSYMEIYNEEINDLLTLGSEKLPIHESLERGVYVSGLREEIVNNAEQVLELLQLGEENRHFGETNMNVRSSRSHTIFRMVIESSAKDQMNSGDAIRVSVLNLVDLAGSERIAKTGADGVRLKEGKHINKSLMILGNVINKLSENGKQRGHIPYRDSKLTRILQSALGGNAKTSIICTAAPEEIHIEETRGTLQFASRAKCVSNCAQVNEILTDAALLKRQKLEIEELRKKLQGSHSEVLEQLILKQRNDMHKFELERDRLAMELEDERRLRETLEHRLAEQQRMLENHNDIGISAEQFTDSIQLDALKTPNCKRTPDGFVATSYVGLDALKTPNCKRTPDGFVASRSRYLKSVEFSPIPENLSVVADEDLWMQLNKGCITDLDALEMTPDFKCPPSLLENTTAVVPLDEPIEATCQRLEKDCSLERQQLEDSKASCATLKKECNLLKVENSSLRQELSKSKHDADHLVSEKEVLLKELEAERYKMEELKQDIRVFSQAFSQRQGQLTSLYTKSKAIVENCKASQVALP